MKRSYRALAALLSAGLLLGFAGCGDSAAPPSPADNAAAVQKGEAITTSSVVTENENFTLSWDDEKKAVFLTDKHSGRVWGTMPSELLQQTEGARGHVLSQAALVLEYIEPNALGVSSITSTVGAVRNGRVLAYSAKDGLYIDYHFDDLGITVPVTYQLLADGVRMACVPANITEGENRVSAVGLAPMMASVPNNTEDSWLFVPSGSGALIGVDSTSMGRTYREEVYGADPAHNVLVTPANSRGVRLPVFGVKQGGDALLGVISSGASTASIEAQAGNDRVKFSSVYASFAIRGIETVEDAKVGTPRYIQIFSEEKNSEPLIAVDYYPLSEQNASYVGMARRFRQYWIDSGVDLQKTAEQPLYLNILGGIQLRQFFLGVPYRATSALTTLEQVHAILDDVREGTGEQPIVKLVGFGNGGLDALQPAGGLTVDRAMGNIDELKNLIAHCKEQNISLYFDFDLLHFSKSGNGVRRLFDTAKAPNRQVTRLYPVHLSLRNPNMAYPASYLVGHSKLESLAAEAIAAAKEWGLTGISFNSVSNTAYSDYGYAGGAVKSGADNRHAALMRAAANAGFSVTASEANAYAIADSVCLFDVPLSSSRQDAIWMDIPFYEMVFKGYVPMGSEPVNMSSDPWETVLRAAEAGCGLTYTLTGSFEKELLDSSLTMPGVTYYEDNLAGIKEQTGRISELLERVSAAEIVSHRITGELREIRYDNGTTVLVNYGETAAATAYGEVPAQDFQLVSGEELP